MTIMVIQCGCLDMMRAEDGKLHSQLEWPNKKSMGRTACMARVIVGLNKIDLEIYLCKHVIQGHAFIWPHLRLATWGLTEYFLLTALAFSRH